MSKTSKEQVDHGRRQLMKGLGVSVGGGLAAGALGSTAASAKVPEHVTDAVEGTGALADRQPLYGVHQSGIVTPRPACGSVVAFDVLGSTPQDLERLFRRLTARIAFLMAGGKPPQLDPKLPPADSGILGPVIEPDNLTITVALGASLFDSRLWLQPLKPKHLEPMRGFPNDALDPERCHGDLTLQICANTSDTTNHALRDIIKHIPDQLVVRWIQDGNVPVVPPSQGRKPESARNFLGFRDGSANPETNDKGLMQHIVWVGDGDGEPEWARGGSYQVVRIIRNFLERWDRTPLGEQENIFGRKKMSGAPFDGKSEFDKPNYAADPEGKITPLDSHIRLANPRRAETEANLILRRPFNYTNGLTKSGQLDQGLLFICYQADLSKGFITVQSRLNGEPLEEYIRPVGGGYFYVLPGVRDASDYLGSSLIAAANRQPVTKS